MFSWTTKILLPLQKFFVPQIAVGLGSKDFLQQFTDVQTVKIRELMLHHLGGDKDAINKMSPREIKALAKQVLKEAKASGIVFPGSAKTISKIFYDEEAEMPKRLNTNDAISIFKMAQTEQALSEKIPVLSSCDGIHYTTIALGGKVSPVLNESIKHDGNSAHDTVIKKGSPLAEKAGKISKYRDVNDNIIVKSTASTHPLDVTRLPNDAETLAHATDDSPSVIEFNKITVGILDHPEIGTIASWKENFNEDLLSAEEKEHSEQNKLFWKIIRDEFITNARVKRDSLPPVPNTKISPRVSEILAAPSIEKLSETRVSMATSGRGK